VAPDLVEQPTERVNQEIHRCTLGVSSDGDALIRFVRAVRGRSASPLSARGR